MTMIAAVSQGVHSLTFVTASRLENGSGHWDRVAPMERNLKAQGAALGNRSQKETSPERAQRFRPFRAGFFLNPLPGVAPVYLLSPCQGENSSRYSVSKWNQEN